ncbi:MAG TPA: neutral/alkaline non-lysosomal ceramidase N-terminal domain-containing protein [Verrucomicrobiae bacterium]
MKLISRGLALLSFLWLVTSSARTEGVRAGAARIDVTPAYPVRMAGYDSRTNLSQGVHDPLSARALAFEQDGARIVLVSLESLGFYNQTADPLRDAILIGNGLKPSELFLCAIHTHSAPTLAFDPKLAPQVNVEYTQELGSKLAALVHDALEHLAPVQIATGSGASPVGVNRRQPVQQANGEVQIYLGRNPSVNVDHEVQVMKVTHADGGEVTAALFAYPCHSTSLGPRNYLISGDIHGIAAQFLEKYLGDSVVTPEFAGASGDIDPWARVLPSFRTDKNWVPETVLLGTFLGEEVARVVDDLKNGATNCVIKTALKTLKLPGKVPPAYLSFASEKADGFNITVARLGGIAFVGLGGEVFNELGKTIKNLSPFQQTFVLTHCNGGAGYIPTAASYPSRGYEVDSSQFAAGAGEKIVNAALQMLEDLQ